jgi:hypothetical protein
VQRDCLREGRVDRNGVLSGSSDELMILRVSAVSTPQRFKSEFQHPAGNGPDEDVPFGTDCNPNCALQTLAGGMRSREGSANFILKGELGNRNARCEMKTFQRIW